MGLLPSIAAAFSRFAGASWSFFKPLPEHQRLGRRGEKLAARHLRRAGYRILYRNFRPRESGGYRGRGEIDLVCRHGETLVFVEVKTRRSSAFAQPGEAVNRAKQRRLIAGALHWLRLLDNPDVLFRFDIVEVLVASGGRARVSILESAFTLPATVRAPRR